MAKVKSLIKRHAVELALGKRTCSHTGNPIPKGDLCLVVFDGPRDRHPYSTEVAAKMIAQARIKLDEIEESLRSH
jgi:hypothetical protein